MTPMSRPRTRGDAAPLPSPGNGAGQADPRDLALRNTVFVTLRTGGPVLEGSLLDLKADTVALLTAAGPHVVPLRDVQRIQRAGDSSFDGAARGALILGLACVLICGQGTTSPGHYARVVAGNAAWGALFGWWFDRAPQGPHDHLPRATAR